VRANATPEEYGRHPVEIDGWSPIAGALSSGEGYAKPIGDGRYVTTASRPPVYPAVLSVWYAVFGYRPDRALVFQIIMSSLVAALLYRLSVSVTGSRAIGVIAAALWCVQYKEFEMDLRLWSEPLFAVMLLAAFLAWRRAERRRSFAAFGGAGATLGLAALTRPEAFLAVPVFLAAALAPRAGARRFALAWLVGAGLVVAPWVLRNAVVFGAFIPGDTTAGFNLYQGTLGTTYAYVREFPAETQARIEGKDEAERDAILRSMALESIRRDPVRYARLCVKRCVLFWFNVPDGSWIPTARSLLFGVPFYALALAGAVVGLRGGWRRSVWIMAGVVAAGVLAHALTIATVRSVNPYLPFVCFLVAIALRAAALPTHDLASRKRHRGGDQGPLPFGPSP
jgi:4-amino-4-deoxy-L-arabinose transferase-like glycosyltransferase